MSICEICGNEIERNSTQCPYCGAQQKQTKHNFVTTPKQIQTINIKIGLPTVNEAIRTAKEKINIAKRKNIRVIKIIHGYGSTGKGGKIRVELREELKKMQNIKIIHTVIYGENFTPLACKQLLRRFPELKKDEDLNKHNRGMTLIEL